MAQMWLAGRWDRLGGQARWAFVLKTTESQTFWSEEAGPT